jgi:chromosome segregation ATPase
MEQQHRNKTMSDTPRTDEWLAEDIEVLRVANYEFTQEIHGLREQRDVIMGRLSETHMRMTEAEKQRDKLAKALESVMAHFSDIAGDCNDEAQREEELKSAELAEQALAAAKGGTP